MMKKISFLFYTSFFFLYSANGQGGIWTWMNGNSIQNTAGAFGTLGTPSVNNHPPGVYEPCEWKDKQGNFWIFGGTQGYPNNLSALWKYNPLTSEWTWVMGNTTINQQPVYGTIGVPAASNT